MDAARKNRLGEFLGVVIMVAAMSSMGGIRFIRSVEMIHRDLALAVERRDKARCESGRQQMIIVNATGDIARLLDELSEVRKDRIA